MVVNVTIIKIEQISIPAIGNQGHNGTLNGLGLFGSFFLKIKTATHIMMNDVNVPKLHNSADIFKSINKPHRYPGHNVWRFIFFMD